ncbi:hypothetical protein [Candidatus Thiosymbion oneisti]|uniref:hypothetical protein n=1 Tax=Candidatus Thiosymbion oneisti TaxID=589554 RepID=UPI0013FD730A
MELDVVIHNGTLILIEIFTENCREEIFQAFLRGARRPRTMIRTGIVRCDTYR